MTALPDPAYFVEVLAPALRQAASIAHALEGRVENLPKSGEATAVKQALTIADTAAQEALLVPLREHFPQVALQAEEDTTTARSFANEGEALVVVDPIDGTLHSYLRSEGPYAVMVGLAIRGRYEAALVALPREGLFFDAVRGRGARVARAGAASRPAELDGTGSRLLVSHGMSPRVCSAVRAAGWEPAPACGGAIAIAPLLRGVRGGLRRGTAAGGISVRGRIGLLITREAGGRALAACSGEAFPDDLETPCAELAVAGDPAEAKMLADLYCGH